MLKKHLRAHAASINLGLRAGIVLLGLLALGYAEIQPVAQNLYELGPDLLADPDMPTGELSWPLKAVWDVLPVFTFRQSGASFNPLGKRNALSRQSFETFGSN